MPELPDVELEKRYLDHTARAKRVTRTHLHAPGLLYHTSAQTLYQNLSGHRITDTHRHGKFLFTELEHGRWLVLHFGMTGTLVYQHADQPAPDYAVLVVELDNDYVLFYLSRRKLGRIGIAASPDEVIEAEDLGPDALAISKAHFEAAIQGGRGQLKNWFMDQSHLAGLGNIYTDELLYHAGLHPRRTLKSLSADDIGRLYTKMQHVLKTAIEHKADPKDMPRTWLLPHRDQKEFNCPRCQGAVDTIKLSGRTTYFCSRCQR